MKKLFLTKKINKKIIPEGRKSFRDGFTGNPKQLKTKCNRYSKVDLRCSNCKSNKKIFEQDSFEPCKI